MNIDDIFKDKSLKPKMKTEKLTEGITSCSISPADLLNYSKSSKDPVKATCIEAMELATKDDPAAANIEWLEFAAESLTAKAPRVKWESARLIGNIAAKFPGKLSKAVENLLVNSRHEGTVVRWSAAFALSEIFKLNKSYNKKLFDEINKIIEREEKNSIKNIYLSAIKAASKL